MARAQAKVPRVLTIAGSDSSGGAGIAADLKAFARCGCHGMLAITAVTAQNTVEVAAVHALSPQIVIDQIRAVCADIGVDAVKIGMLFGRETVDAVADALELVNAGSVVLDPVVAAETGALLLEPAARAAVLERLVPKATVVTPNVYEARLLSGEADAGRAARAILDKGCSCVVVTGGHSQSGCDLYLDHAQTVEICGEVHDSGARHGSGCTYSAALACRLAFGCDRLAAARQAREICEAAIAAGLEDIGAGAGPVDVFGLRGRLPKRR